MHAYRTRLQYSLVKLSCESIWLSAIEQLCSRSLSKDTEVKAGGGIQATEPERDHVLVMAKWRPKRTRLPRMLQLQI